MGHILVTPPITELLGLEEVAEHLRLDLEDMDPDETALLESWIRAARSHVEQRLSIALVEQTWRRTLDGFPASGAPILLPRPPLQSVTSVVYVDPDGAEQTLDAALYVVDVESRPGRIGPVRDTTWPDAANQLASVRITYVAGLDGESDGLTELVEDLRAAMLLLVGDLYRNREAQVSDTLNANRTVAALLDMHAREWDGIGV
jgi:uncharacterized phiE125 gp8 family phage protein